jgi:hypothetical protein
VGQIRALLGILIVLCACGTGQAASLFGDQAMLEVTLKGPLSSVTREPRKRPEHAFELEVDGRTVEVDVRMRGKSRAEYCGFPPLRLNFAPDSAAGSVFTGQDKLKLVTHCKGGAEFEQNVLEELMAYRLMSVLTDFSFRTRLLRIRYVDTDKPNREAVTRFGFVIESDAAFATRFDGEPLLVRDVTRAMLDPAHTALVYVFQYLIGNTDWSLVRYYDDDFCCHNGKLFTVNERNYYVPYDFDMSGLVSARYAKPKPKLRLRSVRVRRYRGYCTDQAVLREALRAVAAQRDDLLRIAAELPGLSTKNSQKQTRYLEDFFAAARNEDKLLKEFERRCL